MKPCRRWASAVAIATGAAVSLPNTAQALASNPIFPEATSATGVPLRVKRYEAAALSLPMGGIQLAGTEFVVYDARSAGKGQMLAALLGPLGVLGGDQAMKSELEQRVRGASGFPDLDQIVVRLIGSIPPDARARSQTAYSLELVPSGWISQVSDANADVSVSLDATLHDASGRDVWTSKYIYHHATPLQLREGKGPDPAGIEVVRTASEVGLAKLFALFQSDLAHKRYPSPKPVSVSDCLPHAREVTQEDESEGLVTMRVKYNYAMGIQTHVFSSGACTLR